MNPKFRRAVESNLPPLLGALVFIGVPALIVVAPILMFESAHSKHALSTPSSNCVQVAPSASAT